VTNAFRITHIFFSGLWSSGGVGVFNLRAPQLLTIKVVCFFETWWPSNPLLSKTAKDPNPQLELCRNIKSRTSLLPPYHFRL